MSVDSWSSQLPMLLDALGFAAHKHRDQRRKDLDASPYINHPIDLLKILVEEAGETELTLLCGALLHDTLEDTEATVEELQERFGVAVSALVLEVSDDKRLPKAARKQAQIDRASTLSALARKVKLADKIANLRDVVRCPPAGWSLDRQREYFDWANAVVSGLRGHNPCLEDLFDRTYQLKP